VTIEDIVRKSPNIRGYGGGKWAIYSVGCCWWTSFPTDLGKHSSGLPCCPHCNSVLMQAPLEDFVDMAKAHPQHYGPGGLVAFVAAHSRNAKTCHRGWEQYAPAS
jgi:hypothetical protein